MRASKALTVCAATVLATVFSVQQGEHGPLVVYKLQLPSPGTTAAQPAPDEPATVIIEDTSSRSTFPQAAPVVTFGGMTLQDPAQQPLALDVPQQASDQAPSSEMVSRLIEDLENGASLDVNPLINVETGTPVTLQEVNDALTWRRETAEKLRQVPIAPRF